MVPCSYGRGENPFNTIPGGSRFWCSPKQRARYHYVLGQAPGAHPPRPVLSHTRCCTTSSTGTYTLQYHCFAVVGCNSSGGEKGLLQRLRRAFEARSTRTHGRRVHRCTALFRVLCPTVSRSLVCAFPIATYEVYIPGTNYEVLRSICYRLQNHGLVTKANEYHSRCYRL